MDQNNRSNPIAVDVSQTPPPHLIVSDRGQERSASVFERNLRALARTSPRAVQQVQSATPRAHVEFLETAEGVLAAQCRELLENASLGATFSSRVNALCSRRAPVREATQIADSIDVKATAAVAIAGFGMGYLPAVIAKRMRRSGVIVICEPDVALLRAVLERVDHSSWINDGNVVVLTDPEDAAAMSTALTGVEGIVMMGLSLIEHPACAQRLGTARAKFYTTFQQVVQAVRTMVATTLVQVDTTVRNLVRNIGYYASSAGIADLCNSAKGKPAIVVSAGPSLERNLDRLAATGVRDRFVIIAAQTVLKPLLKRGIKPHFVTALDYSDISARFYESLTAADVDGVTLVFEPKASSAIPRAFPGVVRCVQDRFLDSMLGDQIAHAAGSIPAGATVAHLAYYLARFMGCDPVVLVGQDLGFTDGQYYAAGAAIHDVWACELNEFNTLEMMEWSRVKRMGRHLRPAVGIHGERLYTDEQMSTYLVQFERDFAKDAARGLEIIDATEGGVRKAHSRPEPLERVVRRILESRGEPLVLPKALATSSTACPSDDVLARLDEIIAGVNRVAEVCKTTRVVLAEMLEHQADQERVNGLITKVESLREQVESYDPAYKLVHFLNQSGAFQRIRSDRSIHLDATLSPIERQRRAIERDIENVASLATAADSLATILRDAMKSFEAESSTSSMLLDDDEDAEAIGEAYRLDVSGRNCFSTIDELDDEPAVAPAPESDDAASQTIRVGTSAPSVWGVIPLNLSEGVTGLKYRPTLESIGAELVIHRTLARLSCVRDLRGIILLTNKPSEAKRLADGASRRKPIVIHEVSQFRPSIVRDRLRAARAWARSCWRGGLGGATCYDEVLHPRLTVEAMRHSGATAALILGPDWCFVDPRLCDQVVERHLADPTGRRLTFSLAPPGLAGCVIERTLLGTMLTAENDARLVAPIGRALSYWPAYPVIDPTGTPCCVNVSPRVRDVGMRFIGDTESTRARLERMWQGLAGMFMEPMADYIAEAVRIDAERFPDPVPDKVVADCTGASDVSWVHWVIESLGAGDPGRAISIVTDGHNVESIAELLRHAKERRVNVHLRVPASLPIDSLRAYMASSPDVLSLDFVPATGAIVNALGPARPDTSLASQLRLGESNTHTLIEEALEGMKVDLEASATWIVPRIAKSDDSLDVIEPFFDRWINASGAAVIDSSPSSPNARIQPLPLPKSYLRRLARSRLLINSRGAALASPTGDPSLGVVGDLTHISLEECWTNAQRIRREGGWFA